MTINEMITKFSLSLADENSIRVARKPNSIELEELKNSKNEIIAELKNRKEAEKRARKEKAEKLAQNVPGLEILRNARYEWEEYHYKYNRYIENDTLGRTPVKPATSLEQLNIQYPVAVAYLKAESYENASNYAKSAAGKKAKERIANGEDYITALTDMEAEWNEHVEANMWN